MRKIFQHIRRQPKTVRNNYAFGFATSFTLVVLFVWLVARPESGSILAQNKETSAEKNIPFASLINETKERFASLKKENLETNGEGNTQAAAVIGATTTASGIVLSQEDITIAQEGLEKSTTTDFLLENKNYQEVLIATTSDIQITKNNGVLGSSTATTTLE